MLDAGVEVRPELVVAGPHGRSVARALAAQLLALPAPPTAIFAACVAGAAIVRIVALARRRGIRYF